MKKYVMAIIVVIVLSAAVFAQEQSLDESEKKGEVVEYTVYDIYRHEDMASGILLGWGGASMGSGAIMIAGGNDYSKGMGVQNVVWGAVDTGLAIWLKNVLNDKIKENKPLEEAEWFRDVMKTNFFVDIAYILTGAAMTIWGDDNIKGHGSGIALQGAFLMVFDGLNWNISEELGKKYADPENEAKQ